MDTSNHLVTIPREELERLEKIAEHQSSVSIYFKYFPVFSNGHYVGESIRIVDVSKCNVPDEYISFVNKKIKEFNEFNEKQLNSFKEKYDKAMRSFWLRLFFR